ncbi:MAG: hypothetical protein A2934_05030 [Candidatus Sungbacteria bacterium RIFCSPLOWO2_01_FULL_47_10]|uniref:endopeptidase La n=1 Tax=Candidatus Sungbacteria bacterium RIFCSPLOWO2_01_FULL_47_10 TaxID=1802276 RepID=A0A1G2L090_9BACT|nr:MAG: hypothetical protein A2934_05030 [Candidatus Sungbacteria bacterium RIFCSPLOWO2_01_FULL_47_10]
MKHSERQYCQIRKAWYNPQQSEVFENRQKEAGMPAKHPTDIPEQLPAIFSQVVCFPERAIQYVIPASVSNVVAVSRSMILLPYFYDEDSTNENSAEFGMVCRVSPTTRNTHPGRSVVSVNVSFRHRCRIERAETIYPENGEPAYKLAYWEKLEDAPVDEETWNSANVPGRLKGLFSLIQEYDDLFSQLLPVFGAPVSHSLFESAQKLLKNTNRSTLARTLDMTANILTSKNRQYAQEILQQVRSRSENPFGFSASIPSLTRELAELIAERSVLARLEKLETLFKADVETIKKAITAIAEVGGRSQSGQSNSWKEQYEQKKNNMPEDAKKEVEKEIDRIGRMNPQSAEYSMAATYLDWALNLPWNDYTVDNEDTREIPRILDQDHHGLPKPKQRVIEFIAAKSFNSGIDNPILCFIGPPGVGKTSLGKSIARALGRKFWRISVGGIHDESEIRGHRRTYVGAEPGRIISTMRRVGKRNPVFMIDEIDKLFGGGAQGSARDAMLEVLDPEQYHNFVDNYLEFGFDLSSILFITTANNIESIPPALRDRMEFIFFPSYNHNEKKHIAREFLIPKQLARHGLTPDSKMFRDGLLEAVTVNITDSVLDVLIGEMTFEAGVRELDRVIGKVMRKVVWKMKNQNSSRQPNVERTDVAAEDGAVWEINERNLSLYIEDAARISKRHALSEDPLPCGVAPIVAVSDTGGSIFYVEAAYRKSEKREIKITGYNPHDEKLGRMLRDSAHKAWDFLFRESGLLNNLGVEEKIYLHITFSNGGIAKDGPSAGISLVLALYSKFTNQPVRHGLVATGENTLALGKILPVGGITNKITTAVRAGAKQFLMPRANEAELADVPEETKNQIEIILCDSMIDALKVAFPNCPRLHDAISNQ